MTIKELREELEKLEKEGYGEYNIALNVRPYDSYWRKARRDIRLSKPDKKEMWIIGEE